MPVPDFVRLELPLPLAITELMAMAPLPHWFTMRSELPAVLLRSVPLWIVKLFAPAITKPPVLTVAVLPPKSQILLPAAVSTVREFKAAATTVLVIVPAVVVRKFVVALFGLPAARTVPGVRRVTLPAVTVAKPVPPLSLIVKPPPMRPLVRVGFQAISAVAGVPAEVSKWSERPAALVTAALVMVRVVLVPPLGVMTRLLAPAVRARLASVCAVTLAPVLPRTLKVPPPRARAEEAESAPLPVMSSSSVPSLTVVVPV